MQRVQNAAVRLILDLNLWDHVTSGDVTIQYKFCPIMQPIHVERYPVYMTDCVQTVANNASRSRLRSANSTLYFTPGYE